MSTIIKSVSLNLEEADFIEVYNLSPTQLLKEKIWEMKGAVKNLVGSKIERMAKVIENQAAELEELRCGSEKKN